MAATLSRHAGPKGQVVACTEREAPRDDAKSLPAIFARSRTQLQHVAIQFIPFDSRLHREAPSST